MDHPEEISLDQQLEEIIDNLDATAKGIARCVLNDQECDPSCLTPKQLKIWNIFIIPELRRLSDHRNDGWAKHLMDRDD